MDYSVYGSVSTVAMLVIFVAIIVWAWSGKRTADFAEAARLPLEDDTEPRRVSDDRNGRKPS